jgi:peptidoglycan lytic transglycosylase
MKIPILSAVIGLWCTFASAAGTDDDFAAAHDAYLAQNTAALERYAGALKGHLLEDYALYWYLDTRLSVLKDVDNEQMRQFFARFPETSLADKLRAQWLKFLGRNQDWENFAREYPRFAGEDLEVTCDALVYRLLNDDKDALSQGRRLWFTGRTTPDSCDSLFERLAAEAALTEADVLARLRLASETGNGSLAREISASFLPPDHKLPEKLWDKAAANPQQLLEKNPAALRSRAGHELTLFALNRIARKDPREAQYYWARVQDEFNAKDQSYAWGRLALHAALNQDPVALDWFARVQHVPLTDYQLAWKARAALRAGSWPDVLAAIESMSETQAREPAWRYWKARALKSQNRMVEANALLLPLSREVNFYGLLAADEVGKPTAPAEMWKTTPAEVDAMQTRQGIARALLLKTLGLYQEGVGEWLWAIRGFDDRQLLAAAEVARRAAWYDRAISTADRTVGLHDYSLRYPTPYRDIFKGRAQEFELDEAWIYGLVRQESRFFADARSRAGALGLMQLMPGTASWVAKRLRWKDYDAAAINQIDMNVTFGAFYMKYMLDELGHPVVATAGYNAGPNRARRWCGEKPMEGAIYVESIPLEETRDYVKRVMSNIVVYAARLGLDPRSLKQRLGTIGGGVQGREEPSASEMGSK